MKWTLPPAHLLPRMFFEALEINYGIISDSAGGCYVVADTMVDVRGEL